ncbi:MAG TPA: alpha/beta hydrolase [Anaerolineales bacterium]|nr:alpha/beta hydrolase [Anaerolineales bacterium]
MLQTQPPTYKTYFINLPLTRLHVLESGKGEPLIMVPATISELENWRTLAQFMGQWFHVYFFELPGHGQSAPFQEQYSSQRVAELVGQLADTLGFERFSLLGFSFGGILAMRTFKLLSARIDRMLLIAPCLDHRAIPWSPIRFALMHGFNRLMNRPAVRDGFCRLINNERTVSLTVKFLQRFMRLEDTVPLERKLLATKPSTIEVLNAQLYEILTTKFEVASTKYQTPCYFAMSVHDPLLNFNTTLSILHSHFASVSTLPLLYPFHQPPRPFTFDELNQTFHASVDAFVRISAEKRDLDSVFYSSSTQVHSAGVPAGDVSWNFYR